MLTRAALLKTLAGGLLMGRYSGPPVPQAINPLPPGGAPDIATRVKALTQPFTDAQMSSIAAGTGATASPGIPREAQGYHVLNQTGAFVYLYDANGGSLFAKIPPWSDITGPMDQTNALKFVVLSSDPLFSVAAFPAANWDVRFELFSKQLPVQLVQLQTTGSLSTSTVKQVNDGLLGGIHTPGGAMTRPTYLYGFLAAFSLFNVAKTAGQGLAASGQFSLVGVTSLTEIVLGTATALALADGNVTCFLGFSVAEYFATPWNLGAMLPNDTQVEARFRCAAGGNLNDESMMLIGS